MPILAGLFFISPNALRLFACLLACYCDSYAVPLASKAKTAPLGCVLGFTRLSQLPTCRKFCLPKLLHSRTAEI